MAEAQTAKRPQWFWPVVAIVVLLLAAGGFAAPSVIECSNSSAGFSTCIAAKLADAGLNTAPSSKPAPEPTAVSVAQPADTAELPAATVAPPDFGVRVEANGSIVIAGSGMAGKTVQIFVNGELYGTADVDKSGDWVLVPDAPLPPGGYELTVVDPDTGKPLDKAFVVAINADKSSEPLVVASTPGKASEVLQGLSPPSTAVASAEPAATTPPVEPTAAEPAASAPAEPVAVATAEEPAAAQPAETPVAEPAKPEEPQQVATAAPEEDVVGDVDALQQRIEALKAQAAPSIDAIEIDNGRNYFAGTGADGAVIRVYVDNVVAGDAPVKDGHWLLETDNILKNRSQRVRVDQLVAGTAEVASRAEVDFIFEEPKVETAPTAVAEAPIAVPEPDFGIDTDQPAIVPVAPPVEVAEAAPTEPAVTAPAATEPAKPTEAKPTEAKPAATQVATAPIVVPQPDFGIDTDQPAMVPVAGTVAVAEATPASTPAASDVPAAAAGTTEVASAAAPAGEAAKGDFAVKTGIPVVVVPEEPKAVVATSDAVPVVEAQPEPPVAVVAEAEPVPAAEPEVPKLVAKPVGPVDLGRFATGKAIIRTGDNLWTIARRAYGSGIRYTQIYGANRDQIRNPNLIYPGQVFDLPGVTEQTASQ